ncbi:MAG: hypothetical protein ABR989_04690 [Candidatus Binatus soli]|jgi:hypothetical protein
MMGNQLNRRPRSVVTNAVVKHGIFSKSKEAITQRQDTVNKLVNKAYRAMKWLSTADRPTLRSWAELVIVTSQAFNNLMGEGILQKDGDPRRLLKDFRQLKLAQLRYEEALLMTPAARAAVLGGKDGAPIDLVAHFAKTVTPDKDNGETEKE